MTFRCRRRCRVLAGGRASWPNRFQWIKNQGPQREGRQLLAGSTCAAALPQGPDVLLVRVAWGALALGLPRAVTALSSFRLQP